MFALVVTESEPLKVGGRSERTDLAQHKKSGGLYPILSPNPAWALWLPFLFRDDMVDNVILSHLRGPSALCFPIIPFFFFFFFFWIILIAHHVIPNCRSSHIFP